MKKACKVIVAITVILSILLSLAGCSPSAKAESAVKGMFKALKKLDFEAAEKYVDVNAFNLSEVGNDLSPQVQLVAKYLLSKMTYEIVSSEEVNENIVKVTVKVRALDLMPVLTRFGADYLKYTLSYAFTSPKPSEKEVNEKVEEIIKTIVADGDLKYSTTEVTLEVVQENGKWRVASGKTLFDALFGGVSGALKTIAELFL